MKRLLHLVLLFTFLLPSGGQAGFADSQPAAGLSLQGEAIAQTGEDETPPEPRPQGWFEPTWMLSGVGAELAQPSSVLNPFLLEGSDLAGAPLAPFTSGDWENGWAWACITPLGVALNASLGASLAASPPFDLAFQLAEYAANMGLKLCAPVVYPPLDFEVSHNKEQLQSCGYTFEQHLTSGEYKNFYGLTLPWGDVFPGNDWGDFGQPAVLHWNTDVDVRLKNPGWTRILEFPVGPGEVRADQYWLPSGVHNLVWRGDTLVNPADFILLYIPGIAWLKMSKIAKIAKYADTVKDNLDYGLLGLDLLLGEVLPGYPTGMFNEETQRVAITDRTAPTLSISAPTTVVQALDPGGISRSKYLGLLRSTLSASDNCDPNPDVYAANEYSLPDFAPLGSTHIIQWAATDRGPRSLNGENNTTTRNQTFTVVDTLAPIILAPPDIVTETLTLPALLNPGNPATFDLADLDPSISHNACTRPGVVCAGDEIRFPAGKTSITWNATDDAGNTSSATQLVNVKSLGANRAPTANSSNAQQAISYEPITLNLTAQDPDLDPLWFEIEQQPGNGFFHSPLYPYFIQDYRLANFQDISFLEWCADTEHRSQYIPTNWPVDARFMAVADDGRVFVFDNGMVRCDQFGDVSTNYRLAVFRPDGTWEQIISTFDTKDIYVDFHNGYIYTTSTNVGSTFDWVRRFDLDLNPVDQFRIDYADVPIDSPRQAVMDTQGLIYVTNGFEYSGTTQLYVYDTIVDEDLVRVADYSQPGAGWMDVALDSQGNLYASERYWSRVYKFSPAVRNPNDSVTPGTLIGWMGKCDSGPGCDIANKRSFGFSCNEATCALNSGSTFYGSLPGQFNFPRGIGLDPNDILYVTDYNNLRVQRFTPDGYYAGQARSEDDGSSFVLGDFGRPRQVTVNSSHFYVLDDNSDLLHVFETTPLTRVDDTTARIVYQSDNNFTGTDSFTFRVTDGMASSAPATVNIPVGRNHRPPILKPLPPLTMLEDGSLPLPVNAYDPDEHLDTITFQADTPITNGVLSGDPSNPVYVPNPDFAGQELFTLVASDGVLLSEPQTITITVTPVNDVPSFPTEGEGLSQGFAFRLAGEHVSMARFAALGAQDTPMQIGRGYRTLFTVNYYDPDDLDTHMVTVNWGDGSPLETEGKLLEDGTITGPLLTEGQTGGSGTVTAEHVFHNNGSYTVSICITDNVLVDSNGDKTPTGSSTTGCKSIPVEVSAMADILMEIEPSANPMPVGGDMSYHLKVTNNPPESGAGVTATGMVVSDILDARLQYLSSSTTQGTCSQASGVVTCQIGTLAPGESVQIQIQARMSADLEAGNVLSNQASYVINQADQAGSKANLDLTTLVPPANFIVDILSDAPDADLNDGVCATAEGYCTLRAAVEQANAQPGAQSISLADWQVLLNSELVISDDLTLTGLGADHTVIGGYGNNRLLRVTGGASLNLNDLTLQGGVTQEQGGGLSVEGSATLNRVQISGSYAQAGGGGIWNAGTLVMRDSTLSGNQSDSAGGGIASSGSLTLSNVTLSGNQAQTGGGIHSSGTASLTNVTVGNNYAVSNGGGLSGAGSFSLKNSLLASNRAGVSGPNCSATLTSRGYNLIDNLSGCSLSSQAASDQVGVSAGLAPLGMNGGSTQTQPLVSGSRAIDAGSCDLPADQRGQERPIDGNLDGAPACDIGAYEFTPTKLFLAILRR